MHIGKSDASVFRLISNSELKNPKNFKINSSQQVSYLKVQPVNKFTTFEKEISVLNWLNGSDGSKSLLPVPTVEVFFIEGDYEYFIMSEIVGINGVEAIIQSSKTDDKEPTNRVSRNKEAIVTAAALGLKKIHELDISTCPFNETISIKLANAYENVKNGLVDERDFDSERLGRSAHSVYQELKRRVPQESDLVFCHGDYCLPNILFNNFTNNITDNKYSVSGFIDFDRAGVSDKYNDLAISSRSIATNIGDDVDRKYEALFFETYGLSDIDHDKIKYYRMLDELF